MRKPGATPQVQDSPNLESAEGAREKGKKTILNGLKQPWAVICQRFQRSVRDRISVRPGTPLFAVALSGGLSPAEQELFDSEYELSKAAYTADEVKDALAFQKLKNEIIASRDKWDEYAKARATAKDKNGLRLYPHPVSEPEQRPALPADCSCRLPLFR